MARKPRKMTPQVQPDQVDGMTPLLSGLPTNVRSHIEQRAYELYSSRGGAAGRDLEDWLRAEKEIMRA